MRSAPTREEQALACLEAADQHRVPLLNLARKLTGSSEEGMDLYQQTLLNCHDAIQRNGFAGDRYNFYLAQSMRNLHVRQQQLHGWEMRVDFQHVESGSGSRDDEGVAPWAAQTHRARSEWSVAPAPAAAESDPVAHLAEQVQAEVAQHFSFADRVALRLSSDGLSCQQIAEHIGTKDQSWVNRRLKRMREHLRATFQQAWDALGEPTY